MIDMDFPEDPFEDYDLEDAIRELFGELHPGMDVKFADGFGDNLDDQAVNDVMAGLRKMNARLQSRCFGWFWRWWYRPKEL